MDISLAGASQTARPCAMRAQSWPQQLFGLVGEGGVVTCAFFRPRWTEGGSAYHTSFGLSVYCSTRYKGIIVDLYTDPPAGSTVIDLDELGPIAARSYPGPSWSDETHRPHFHPNYARHGYRWAFGALAHRTGAVFVETAATRDTTAWLHFLDGLEAFSPPGDAYLIVDALPLHWSVDTMLWNWGHPRFHFVPLPKRAAWLNLIEGFWKILGQRALAGRACTSTDDVDHALHAAVGDWNQQPTPFLWGRPPKPRRQLKRQYVYRI